MKALACVGLLSVALWVVGVYVLFKGLTYRW